LLKLESNISNNNSNHNNKSETTSKFKEKMTDISIKSKKSLTMDFDTSVISQIEKQNFNEHPEYIECCDCKSGYVEN